MPNWKKVIVSGSNAILNSLNVTNGITGSLLGTSSYATQALTASNANTASYVNQLNQSVVISGSLTVSGSTNLVGTTGTTLLSTNADTLTFTGSIFTSGSIVSTGSLNITSVTSSLLGTASYATQALTASYIVLAQTASYVLNAVSSSYTLTASNVQGGTQYYVPLWNTNTSLTNSYLNQSGSVLKTIYSGQDRGLTLDYNFNSFVLGNAGVGNNTYLQVYDGGSVINIYTPNYTYFNDKVGVRIIPTNPGLAVSGSLEVTGPGTTKFINTDVQITGALSVTGGITGSLLGTASYATQALSASYSQTASYVNPLIQTVQLTGSLNVSGSTTQVGNNTLLGDTTLSGSVIISGSLASTPTIKIYGDTQQNGYTRFDPVTTNINNSISASYIYVSGSTNDLYFSQNGNGYSNTTRLRWLEGNLYTGLLHGGLITTQSSTVYQVSSGSGIIVSINASIADDPYPTITFIQWPNLSASIAPLSASFDQSFIAIQNAGGGVGSIYAQGTPYDDGEFNTLIPIGNVIHQNRSTINATATYPSVAYAYKQRSSDFIRAFGPLKLSGLNTLPSGSTAGSLIITSGTAYSDGRNYTTDPNNPSYVSDTGQPVSKIFRYYSSGSGFVYLTNGGAGFTTIDPAQYNNNGTLSPVANNKWSIQRVFYFPGGATKGIYVYYGNGVYDSQLEAIANINTENFSEAPNTAAGAILSAILILQGNADFTNTATYSIRQAGLFRNVGGSGGGGAATTNRLVDLSDVLISSPTNGQALVYNSTTLKWENLSYISASISGNAVTATTASYAATASLAPLYLPLAGGTITGNLNINGTASISYLDVTFESASIIYSSGSNQLGDASNDTQTLWGSVVMPTGPLTISQSLTVNQNTSSLAAGTQIITTNSTSSYTSAFYKYTLASGSNARAGQVMAVWNGASIQYTDVATNDIGTTSNVTLTASLSGGNVLLTTTLPSSGWTVKTLVNLL